ncbi:MAG: Coenzyme F420 hydrogenase/dehydrogenase, beta subunit C-terminal domain [Candidatus Krumholzibacteriota bacterium]|nr:Coenzyme F420 hydrogenase/dehydrogenase, beta subunit C-terminal domain [Candidatus Krumholzibacteriota bacterium]
MSARRPCDILLETIVERGLCTRCGTCVGACPTGNLSIADPTGRCLPVAGDDCTSCGSCLAGCPGGEVDFGPLEESLFGERARNELLGVVRTAWLAHAVDPSVRRGGASGGVITALLLRLVESKETAGAVVFGDAAGEPWRGEGAIARTREDILAASQSRYHLSPLNTVLSGLRGRAGRYAYVGLPCHVHGLRKLESAGWSAGFEIAPVIGVYCGNNLYYEATRAMLGKLGIKRVEDIERLRYREGPWPGFFHVRTRDGRTASMSKLDFNQAIPFWVNRRCLFCIDLTNELADLSVGDGWAREGRGEEGWSILLARTVAGERIVEAATASGAIVCEEITVGDAERMHSHGFDLKKRGAFLRLRLWRGWGVKTPRYDRAAPHASIRRRAGEVAVSLQFLILATKPARALFRLLPAGALGGAFRLARRLWMRRTAGR